MDESDATEVIRRMAKYPEFFVDVMMAEELQLQVPEENHMWESFKEGCIMFSSFATFGAMPLLGYVIIPLCYPEMSQEWMFNSACIVTGVVLFIMGCVKSMFSASNWFLSGMETLLLGGCCATVAYTIGQIVEQKTGAKA